VPTNKESASLLPHNRAMVARFGRPELHVPVETVEVETRTLDDLRLSGDIDRADYIKIDVEGAELSILQAGQSVLRDCLALKIECSFLFQRVSQPRIWDVAIWLAEVGFELVDIRDVRRWRRTRLPAHPYRASVPVPYSRGEAAQCDLVVLRSADRVVEDDQALRLLVISAALGYFDYAIALLRTRPDVAAHALREVKIDLESELRAWSAITGGIEVRKALRSTLRGVVPLVRAWAGRLPHESNEAER